MRRDVASEKAAPHVSHVVLSLEPGGLEELICRMVTSPELADLPTTVCCLDEPGRLAPQIARPGARVTILRRRPGLDPGLVWRLVRFFRRTRPDVLHTHSLDPMFYAGLAGWLAGVPLRLHTQHNTWLGGYGRRERLKYHVARRCFDFIVAVSAQTDREVARYGVPPSRRRIILNGIDAADYAAPPGAARSAGPLTLGTVARLAPEKGIHRLLEAFAELRTQSPDLRLTIVGDGPEREALERRSAELDLGPEVSFTGYCKDVRARLAQLDIFVLPSITEGIPLALLEAMAAGLPLVATSVGGVPEVVQDEISGLLVPPDDAAALVRACGRLIEQPELRRRLGHGATETVKQRFRFSTMANAYRALYGSRREAWHRRLVRLVRPVAQ